MNCGASAASTPATTPAAKGSSSGGGSHAENASSEVTEDRRQLGRRLLAFAGLWLVLGGLLAALSFVVFVVVATGAIILATLAVLAVRHLRRVRVGPAVGAAAASTVTMLREHRPEVPELHVRDHAQRLGVRARQTAAEMPERTNTFVAVLGRLAVKLGRGLTNALYRVGILRLYSVDLGRRALELNELGAQLRREGDPERAAERHRAALAIVRNLGDRQAEAMTLNNLGLALASSGADQAAVEYLAQAANVLRALGDGEHEGRVIANLGVVYQRQGHSEEAAVLFQEALEKLPPASPAYHQVEKELGRAS